MKEVEEEAEVIVKEEIENQAEVIVENTAEGMIIDPKLMVQIEEERDQRHLQEENYLSRMKEMPMEIMIKEVKIMERERTQAFLLKR